MEQSKVKTAQEYTENSGMACEYGHSVKVMPVCDVLIVMKQYSEQFKRRWIPVTERLPERHQRVMFVVKSDNEWYNGKVYGGVYTDPDFTTPGIGFEATHWMPLPDAP